MSLHLSKCHIVGNHMSWLNCSSFIHFQKFIQKSRSFLHYHSILPVLGSYQFICCSYKRKKLCTLLNFVNICFFVILTCVLGFKAVYPLRFLSYGKQGI